MTARPMFNSVLIANRGEIACRILRTARRMGVRGIAVYSDADANAAHVAMADAAVGIGPAPARASYLDIGKIIDAARRTGAEAVHPGYGFLSENAEFAEACVDAGLVFVGPPAAAIRAMGSKSAAKALMETAGVPLVPGYHGADQDAALLAEAAARITYPVLIKASAGGGGKGMRVVEHAGDFAMSLERAKAEAKAAFGDDNVLIEKYLTRPRHIEIQVFADTHGNVVSLFERDCSIQRRHQKIVEEAPAPSITEAMRLGLGEAACAAARAIDYVGAGTVEFIVEGDDFHFMEMNTRLQVEHPVTEAITGLDLVEWQFRVAAGEALPLTQNEIERRGHAIEVRVYAEDPARDFAPSTGRLSVLSAPAEDAHIRVESGVREGDAVSVHYDPMIAKLIAWDVDRDGAIRQMNAALGRYEIDGVQTNLDLLRRITRHPDFAAADLDTGFIARHAAALLPEPEPAPPVVLAAAAHRWLQALPAEASSAEPCSPWAGHNAWRLNGARFQDLVIDDGVMRHPLRIYPTGAQWFRLEQAGRSMAVTVSGIRAGTADDTILIDVDGVTERLRTAGAAPAITVFRNGVRHHLAIADIYHAEGDAAGASERVITVMPGKVIEIAVGVGDTVSAGDLLVVIEAMKVQFRITAPRDGVVASLHCVPGDLVEEGVELIVFAENP